MFATVDDVRRIMRIPRDNENLERDSQLRGALMAIESWAEPKLGHLARQGQQAEVYFDVREDEPIYLPSPDVIVTKIKILPQAGVTAWPYGPFEMGFGWGYEQTDDGRLLLRPSMLTQVFDGVAAERLPRRYDRVEVFYMATGAIPQAVTEGIALLAAGYYAEGPQLLAGLKSESIGDYSYTVAGGTPNQDESNYVGRGLWFLRDYMPRSRVRVI